MYAWKCTIVFFVCVCILYTCHVVNTTRARVRIISHAASSSRLPVRPGRLPVNNHYAPVSACIGAPVRWRALAGTCARAGMLARHRVTNDFGIIFTSYLTRSSARPCPAPTVQLNCATPRQIRTNSHRHPPSLHVWYTFYIYTFLHEHYRIYFPRCTCEGRWVTHNVPMILQYTRAARSRVATTSTTATTGTHSRSFGVLRTCAYTYICTIYEHMRCAPSWFASVRVCMGVCVCVCVVCGCSLAIQ